MVIRPVPRPLPLTTMGTLIPHIGMLMDVALVAAPPRRTSMGLPLLLTAVLPTEPPSGLTDYEHERIQLQEDRGQMVL